jgi:GNAT superfamily N-acetyltransferase
MLEIRFAELSDTSSDDFLQAMSIYKSSFPDSELRPVDLVKEFIRIGKSRLVVGRLKGEVVMMSLLYPVPGTGFLLGDYLAVAEGYRGKGYGEHFFGRLFGQLLDLNFDCFLGEVESPYIAYDSSRIRRIEILRKLGMRELKGIRYLLPSYDGSPPRDMILMIKCRERATHLDGSVIIDVITKIFAGLYGKGSDNEILQQILESVPEVVSIE